MQLQQGDTQGARARPRRAAQDLGLASQRYAPAAAWVRSDRRVQLHPLRRAQRRTRQCAQRLHSSVLGRCAHSTERHGAAPSMASLRTSQRPWAVATATIKVTRQSIEGRSLLAARRWLHLGRLQPRRPLRWPYPRQLAMHEMAAHETAVHATAALKRVAAGVAAPETAAPKTAAPETDATKMAALETAASEATASETVAPTALASSAPTSPTVGPSASNSVACKWPAATARRLSTVHGGGQAHGKTLSQATRKATSSTRRHSRDQPAGHPPRRAALRLRTGMKRLKRAAWQRRRTACPSTDRIQLCARMVQACTVVHLATTTTKCTRHAHL